MGLREAKTGKGHEQTESVEGQTEVNMLESRSINKAKVPGTFPITHLEL